MRSALQWLQEDATSKRSIFFVFWHVFCLFTFLFVCLYVFLFVFFFNVTLLWKTFLSWCTLQEKQSKEEEERKKRIQLYVFILRSHILHPKFTVDKPNESNMWNPWQLLRFIVRTHRILYKIQSRREIQNNGFLEDSPRERKWGKHNLSRQPGAISILFNNLSSPYDCSGR